MLSGRFKKNWLPWLIPALGREDLDLDHGIGGGVKTNQLLPAAFWE